MSTDLTIEVDNTPGALARVAAAISDAGVNIAAAACLGGEHRAEVHILVPHAEPVRHALAISHMSITSEREVASLEQPTLNSDFEPTGPCRDDMEADAVFPARQLESPVA